MVVFRWKSTVQNRDLIWYIDRALQLLARDVPEAYCTI